MTTQIIVHINNRDTVTIESIDQISTYSIPDDMVSYDDDEIVRWAGRQMGIVDGEITILVANRKYRLVNAHEQSIQADLNDCEYVDYLLSDNYELQQYAESINTDWQLLQAILLECERAGDVIDNADYDYNDQRNINRRLRKMGIDEYVSMDDHGNEYLYLCGEPWYL